MAKLKFEYIWLDGYKPEPNLRSKTKVIETSKTAAKAPERGKVIDIMHLLRQSMKQADKKPERSRQRKAS